VEGTRESARDRWIRNRRQHASCRYLMYQPARRVRVTRPCVSKGILFVGLERPDEFAKAMRLVCQGHRRRRRDRDDGGALFWRLKRGFRNTSPDGNAAQH
jgi:hypothetical protein